MIEDRVHLRLEHLRVKLDALWKYVAPPVSPDPEMARIGHILAVSAVAGFLGIALSLADKLEQGFSPSVFILAGETAAIILVLALNKRGATRASSLVFTLSIVSVATGLAFFNHGLHDVAMWMFPAIVLISGLLLQNLPYLLTSSSVLAATTFLYIAENSGFSSIRLDRPTSFDDFLDAMIILTVTSIAVGVVSTYVRQTIRESAGKSDLLQHANVELEERAERLRNSEAEWRSIVETAPTVIMNVSRHGTIEFTNDRGSSGVSFSVGIGIEELLHPSYVIPFREAFATVLSSGEPKSLEAMIRSSESSSVWYALIIGPVYRSRGVEDLTIVGLDITDRKLQEAHIQSLNEELERRVRDRTSELQATMKDLEAFSYSVSHDLRAPLRHIAGYAEMALNDVETQNSAGAIEHLSTVRKSALKLRTLVDELLSFSRLGRAEIRSMSVSADAMLDEVWNEVLQEAGERTIQYRCCGLPVVYGDPLLLRQAFANLLRNALKFTKNKSEAIIEVQCSTTNSEHVISIRDNGAGFDPAYSDRLFGVFQRLHAESEFEGTGIGLANVKSIIQRHGGRVWAEGREDAGATFYVALPACPAMAPVERHEDA